MLIYTHGNKSRFASLGNFFENFHFFQALHSESIQNLSVSLYTLFSIAMNIEVSYHNTELFSYLLYFLGANSTHLNASRFGHKEYKKCELLPFPNVLPTNAEEILTACK